MIGSVALVFVLLLSSTLVHGQQPAGAGRIKSVSGAAFVIRQRSEIPAQLGQVVFEADGLKTGSDGRLGLTMNDDTRVALGPDSEIRLNRFLYVPAEGRLAF